MAQNRLTAAGWVTPLDADDQLARQTFTGFNRPFSSVAAGVTGGNGVVVQLQAPAPFEAVRLIYSNYNAAAGYTVSAAGVVSPTTDLEACDTLTPVIATFGGAATLTLAAASGSGDDVVPTYGISDLLHVKSANELNLLHARSYFAAAAAASTLPANFINAYRGYTGRKIASKAMVGDGVTTWNAQIPSVNGTWWAPHDFQFYFTVPCRTIACAGDSLTRGQGSTGGYTSAGERVARALTNSGFVLSYAGHGISSQKHAASMATARNIINTTRPDIIALFAWSPNDGAATQAVMDQCWVNLLDVVDLAIEKGVKPIICTSGPRNALSDADDARRQAQNDRVRRLNLPVADFATALENPLDRTVIRTQYDSGDNLHYNDAGYQAMADILGAVVVDVLREEVGSLL